MSSKLLVVSSAFFFYLVIIFSVLAFCRVWAVFSKHLLSLGISIIGTQLLATPPPLSPFPPPTPSVPSLFTVTCSVRWCLLSSLVLGGLWLGCQDLPAMGVLSSLELAPISGSSWIPLPLNFHFATQLLTYSKEEM